MNIEKYKEAGITAIPWCGSSSIEFLVSFSKKFCMCNFAGMHVGRVGGRQQCHPGDLAARCGCGRALVVGQGCQVIVA